MIYVTEQADEFGIYYFCGALAGILDSGNSVLCASIMAEYKDETFEANTLNIVS